MAGFPDFGMPNVNAEVSLDGNSVFFDNQDFDELVDDVVLLLEDTAGDVMVEFEPVVLNIPDSDKG